MSSPPSTPTSPSTPSAPPPSTPSAGTLDRRPNVDANTCRSVLGRFAECPLCGGDLRPEHAHFKCAGCGWRDSCCD